MLDHYTDQTPHFEPGELDDPDDAIRNLEQRLARGWDVIASAERKGEPVEALFDHFSNLLREYEDLCDRRAAA